VNAQYNRILRVHQYTDDCILFIRSLGGLNWQWCSALKRLSPNTSVCGRCRRYQGFRTDVGCCGKTVLRIGIFSRTCLVTRTWLFSSSRTWASFGVTCVVTSAKEICVALPLIGLMDLGDDVGGKLLETGVVGRRPSGTADGYS
jgi:hypothetical protein